MLRCIRLRDALLTLGLLSRQFSDDPARKTITVSGMGRSNSAQWQSERQGCRLNP